MFLDMLESCLSKFGDFTIFSYKLGVILGHFLPKESFEDVMMDFFGLWKNLPWKNDCDDGVHKV
jgi:hypothetical protein